MRDYDKVVEAASEFLFWTPKKYRSMRGYNFANAQQEYARCRKTLLEAVIDYHSCKECPCLGTNSCADDCGNYPPKSEESLE